MAQQIKRLLFLSITAVFFLGQSNISSAQNAVKATYWFPESEFPVSDIDSTLFTHIFCAFADLNPQTNQITVSAANQPKFSTFTQTVKRKNPSVKTLLSIGGGRADKAAFASMASNANSRKAFIDSSIRLAKSYGFNGLDLDWEYPSNAAEMSGFGSLLREWRAAVNADATRTGTPRLILAAAVFYSSNYYSVNYPATAVADSLDWINLMAYDFYGPGWSRVTGPPAALYKSSNSGPDGDSGVRLWIQSGVPAKKLVLGFPFYGYAWRLANAGNHGYFAPAVGAAVSQDGSIGYGAIRKFVTDNNAVTVYNSTVVGDYCYAGTTWIGYDDTQSIVTKVKYVKQKGLLGYFSWHVGADNNGALSRTASQELDRTG